MKTLAELAESGIEADCRRSSRQYPGIRVAGEQHGQLSGGLILMLRALTGWLYDADPLALVAYEKPLEALKEADTIGQGLF